MKEKTLSCKEILLLSEKKLSASGISEPKSDSRLIVMEYTGFSFTDLILNESTALSTETVDKIFSAVDKRCKKYPLQYILGRQSFMGLDFLCSENVLIPRFDTEILVEAILEKMSVHSFSTAIELCTGSGCIAASLAYYADFKKIYASDISPNAINLSKENFSRLGVSEKIELLSGNLWEPFGNIKADIIVSNPPYIPSSDIDFLMDEVRLFEPSLALDGGLDGLSFYKAIINEASFHLNEGGFIFLETGFDQKIPVSNLLLQNNFTDIETKNDLGGNHRVVIGRIKRGF